MTPSPEPHERPPRDPASRYDTPEELLADPDLEPQQKRAMLEDWLIDEERRAESQSEGMTSGEVDVRRVMRSRDAIVRALRRLDEA